MVRVLYSNYMTTATARKLLKVTVIGASALTVLSALFGTADAAHINHSAKLWSASDFDNLADWMNNQNEVI